MKTLLLILLKLLISLITLTGLFFGLSVSGQDEALTTQIGTIFYFFVVPFVVVALSMIVLAELTLIVKKLAGKFVRVHFAV
ncbi:uncharacterized membrane protein (DUF106 family) [Neisseria sp. HSC-16F19]|nr:hypothetical protein [Neisseria sp. HSC-16F19]MCP2041576.1 uncharacterized membrane protein (DUF106 family) [Neisseria sp. HSC-16F19]